MTTAQWVIQSMGGNYLCLIREGPFIGRVYYTQAKDKALVFHSKEAAQEFSTENERAVKRRSS